MANLRYPAKYVDLSHGNMDLIILTLGFRRKQHEASEASMIGIEPLVQLRFI